MSYLKSGRSGLWLGNFKLAMSTKSGGGIQILHGVTKA
jgi:hypothetical protein